MNDVLIIRIFILFDTLSMYINYAFISTLVILNLEEAIEHVVKLGASIFQIRVNDWNWKLEQILINEKWQYEGNWLNNAWFLDKETLTLLCIDHFSKSENRTDSSDSLQKHHSFTWKIKHSFYLIEASLIEIKVAVFN